MKHTIEISDHHGEVQGLVNVGIDGFVSLHRDWLKELALEAGYTYEEVIG